MSNSVVVCPNCQSELKLKGTLPPGKKARCPKCGSIFDSSIVLPAPGASKPASGGGKPPSSGALRRDTLDSSGSQTDDATLGISPRQARAEAPRDDHSF